MSTAKQVLSNEVDDMMDLHERIHQLEMLQKRQTEEIKDSFRALTKSLSPKNLLKSAVKTVVDTPGLKATALDTAVSALSGTLGRRLIVGKSKNIFRKAVGSAVKFVITNVVRNKMPVVKKTISSVTNKNGKTLLHH